MSLTLDPTPQEVLRFYGSQILSMIIRVGSKGKTVIDPQKLDPWRIDGIPDWALSKEELLERRQKEMEDAFNKFFDEPEQSKDDTKV